MEKESILSKNEMSAILDAARFTKETGQQIVPALLILTADGVRNALYLADMPDDGDKKAAYFRYIGEQLRSHNAEVAEAVFISEAWALTGLDGRTGIMPSLHPKRIEAIVIVGRNAANTRMSCVIQPFAQNKQGKPEWRKTPLAAYDEPVSEQTHLVGLLDHLFEALGQP